MAGKPQWNRSNVRSGFEARIRKDLDRRKIKYGYETIKLAYTKLACKHCGEVVDTGVYTPDFIIERPNGVRLVVEGKGRFTSADRSKMLKVQQCNPKEDIRFVFQRDNPIRKGSKTRNGDWALKHGFPYCIGESIPDEWIR